MEKIELYKQIYSFLNNNPQQKKQKQTRKPKKLKKAAKK